VQLEIAQRLHFLKMTDYKHTQIAVEEIGRMLNGLITSLQPDDEYER
jgi:four helix bundle protein